VLFIPWLGDKMLPDQSSHANRPGLPQRLSERLRRGRARHADAATDVARHAPATAAASVAAVPHDPYQTRFYLRFRGVLDWSLRHRWLVIVATVAAFALSLALFRFVPQQFFPDSTRLELMVDMELAEGSSLRATEAQARRLEAMLSGHEGVDNYVAYVGTGSPRFYLPLDQQLPQT